jgi:hypothetical protein
MNDDNQKATIDKVWATLDRLTESQAEIHLIMKESARKRDEDHAKWEEQQKKSDAKWYAKWKKLHEEVIKLNNMVGGMGTSNGDFAEESFYNSLKESNMEFFGVKFDRIARRKLAGTRSKLDAEYDAVLYNGKVICIVEIKYKAQKKLDFNRLFERVEIFKTKYPEYANHQFYLALAAFAFHAGIEDRCAEEGIAVFKQKGDTIVVSDKNLKVF